MYGSVGAVFLDRDGVINVNRPDHVKNWEEFQFLPGSLEALAELATAGLPVFVITNQAVINRGLVPQEMVDAINAQMKAEIERHGGRVDGVLYCPHAPEEGCGCRKPRPGLLVKVASTYGLNLQCCYMVGDALTDIEAGQAVGCETIMVLTGRGLAEHGKALRIGCNGYHLVRNLGEAVSLILRNSNVAPALVARRSQ